MCYATAAARMRLPQPEHKVKMVKASTRIAQGKCKGMGKQPTLENVGKSHKPRSELEFHKRQRRKNAFRRQVCHHTALISAAKRTCKNDETAHVVTNANTTVANLSQLIKIEPAARNVSAQPYAAFRFNVCTWVCTTRQEQPPL